MRARIAERIDARRFSEALPQHISITLNIKHDTSGVAIPMGNHHQPERASPQGDAHWRGHANKHQQQRSAVGKCRWRQR